ncbi:unnamed protein product [Vitrella brassicaformis CCMP3155]|uniref:Thioredoxin domain-containing protein n=2 Tax=Vitrella brassicaformis TaxID=1169539 RepID=A0A0G4H7D7_VITBC|nr:unnamed protein product [Vitrella brassicaformis CCMP3155]|eukprot:CEM39782.1 unnamed protein product [Vitrella brassicaformis CCMP3155]
MKLSRGNPIPSARVRTLPLDAEVMIDDIFRGKRSVLFAVPGAFTPTCSEKHLPGFLEKVDEIKSFGVDVVACLAVNDPFVLKAWSSNAGVEGRVMMISDGNAEFTRASGMELDASRALMGLRARRFACVVNSDLEVEWLGEGDNSFVDSVLEYLKDPSKADAPKTTRREINKPIKEVIDDIVREHKVVLFMKGTPSTPQCGFSASVVAILRTLGLEFVSVDVLSSMAIREGIKEFSDWPTIPQLYVSGEFVGGADIVSEMFDKGELQQLLINQGLVEAEPAETG